MVVVDNWHGWAKVGELAVVTGPSTGSRYFLEGLKGNEDICLEFIAELEPMHWLDEALAYSQDRANIFAKKNLARILDTWSLDMVDHAPAGLSNIIARRILEVRQRITK